MMLVLLIVTITWSTALAQQKSCMPTYSDTQCHIVLETTCEFHLDPDVCTSIVVTVDDIDCVWLWSADNNITMQTRTFGYTEKKLFSVNTSDILNQTQNMFVITCLYQNKMVFIFLGE